MAASKKPKSNLKKYHKTGKPWEPDAKQMEWYRQWSEELMTLAEIGRQSKPPVNRSTVMESVHKTGDWLQVQSYDKIMRFRTKQTHTLERLASEAFQAWKRSIGKHDVTTTKSGSSAGENGGPYNETAVRSEELIGSAAFLAEARAALAEIRKIWGCDQVVKSSIEILNPNEVEGLPQMNAFASHAEALAAVSKVLAERAAVEAARSTSDQ